SARVDEFLKYLDELDGTAGGAVVRDTLLDDAREMRLEILRPSKTVRSIVGPVVTTRVPSRDKRIAYDPKLLPQLDPKREYSAADVVTSAMKVFARDRRVV